jgi:hypothetical protein
MNPSSPSSRNRASDESTLQPDIFSHGDHSTTNMASDVDRRLHDVGVAALAAVSQYPRPVNDHSGSFFFY